MRACARLRIGALLGLLAASPVAASQGGAPAEAHSPTESSLPFEEGSVLGHAESAGLAPWLPPELFEARRFLFYDGMQMEIGPSRRDYTPAPVYEEASRRFAGRATIGRDGSLDGYVAGRPFDVAPSDCTGDPQAGVKLAWNLVHRWQGFGDTARFRYVRVDARGGTGPAYEGRLWSFQLKHRPEPRYAASRGDLFLGERRAQVVAFVVDRPLSSAGTRSLTYRYAASFGPLDTAIPEDTWLYSPRTGGVRTATPTERGRVLAGTDFRLDDLHAFSGIPPQYEWTCVEARAVLAPMNTTRLGFPYIGAGDHGPSRLSYASDRWELRDAFHVRLRPKDAESSFARKELWIDRQTAEPLYAFVYDREGGLWKVITHNHRWSEDDLGRMAARSWYPGWESVPDPRDLRIVSESIVDVQTGTGSRLDLWDSHGAPPAQSELKRLIDLNGLRQEVGAARRQN